MKLNQQVFRGTLSTISIFRMGTPHYVAHMARKVAGPFRLWASTGRSGFFTPFPVNGCRHTLIGLRKENMQMDISAKFCRAQTVRSPVIVHQTNRHRQTRNSKIGNPSNKGLASFKKAGFYCGDFWASDNRHDQELRRTIHIEPEVSWSQIRKGFLPILRQTPDRIELSRPI